MNTQHHSPDGVWGHRRRTNSLFRRLTPWLVVALLLQSFSFPLAVLAADDQAVASLEAKLRKTRRSRR